MTDTNEVQNQPLLKTDVMGRLRTPRERREKLLDEFEQSGLSGGEFAAMVGIMYENWAGDPWSIAVVLTENWKRRHNYGPPSPGTYLWLEKGYYDYSNFKSWQLK